MAVMMRHYIDEEDEQLRQRSNRTFLRMIAGLPPEVVERYGHVIDEATRLRMSLNDAIESGNLDEATRLLEKMKGDGES